MAERIIIRQDHQFKTLFLTADPEDPASQEFEVIETIHQLTPYGMLLASLGSCTALVLHTYAQSNDIPLIDVEIHLDYQRVFRDDCEDCDEDQKYAEEINERILLKGDLPVQDRVKLLRAAHYCPVYKMILEGIQIKTELIEGRETEE
jgi:putative redox protein